MTDNEVIAERREMDPCVYILVNAHRTVFYVGVTSDLATRVWQHKNKQADGFTSKYNVDCLVYYEQHHDMASAIQREKRIKRWRREWKVELIEGQNPDWVDLFSQISS